MILLFMSGGMASTETFDPKHYEPFSPGIEAKRVLSTFPAINTSLDGVKISEGLENVAKVMDRCTLIRTMQAADLGKILHSRHQFHVHTGYVPPVSVPAPHIGAWIARTLGPRHPDVPGFIDIAEPFRRASPRLSKPISRAVPRLRVRPLPSPLPRHRRQGHPGQDERRTPRRPHRALPRAR